MKHQRGYAKLACVFFLWACSSDPAPNQAPSDAGAFDADAGAGGDAGAGDAGLGDAGATPGTSPGATASIDSSGGELDFEGVTVMVPAGALTASVNLTLRRVGTSVSGYHAYSDVFELAPRGIRFAKSVKIDIPYHGEQTLANVFAMSSTISGYRWVGTATSDTVATASVDHSGRFFVANGADYTEPPDDTCTRVDVIDGVFTSSRTVNLLVSATDCQGRALASRKAGDFTALEDGEPLDQSLVSLRVPAPLAPFLTVLVDVALLKAAPAETEVAVSGALATLNNPGLRVGVSLYGEADPVTELVAPTLDSKAVAKAVKQLSHYAVPNKLSAGSFTGVSAVAAELDGLRTSFRARNAGGAFGEAFIIWATASDSNETKAAQTAALSAVADSGARVVTVSLGEASAGALGNDEWFAAVEPAGLGRAFAAATQRLNALISSSYWLGYCSQSADGVHGVGARLASSVFELGRNGLFDATGSLPGCNEATPLEACGARECGGAGCGACDDTASECDHGTGKCRSYCLSQHWCGGSSHDNPNGYSQKCADSPSNTECSKACVDLQVDGKNCGSCGSACPAQTTCTGGQCTCNAGYELCDGACVDTSLNSKNCGKCGTVCGAGQGCFGGTCAADCPTSLHGPALVKVPTPSGGISCIDATEVTEGQYREFLQDRAGDVGGQAPECTWNLYFEPPEYCTYTLYTETNPEKHPQQCVDWCDASAFCRWAGKRLCGGIDQAHVPMASLADASVDAWYNACSSGGVNKYPFGNTCQSPPCKLSYSSAEVGQFDGCQATGAYKGVFDLVGNVQEWEDSCSGLTGNTDVCQFRGAGYGMNFSGDCSYLDQLEQARCSAVDPLSTRRRRDIAATDLGFRCCAR